MAGEEPRAEPQGATSGVEPAAGAAAGEGDAERAARLERELQETKAKHETLKQEHLAGLSHVEEANRIREQARRANATDNGAGANPEAITAEDVENLRLLARHEDPYTRAVARAQLASLNGVVQGQNELAIAESPEAIRGSVRQAWQSGQFRTVQAARAHVEASERAKSADPLKQEVEALKKRIAEFESATPQAARTHTPSGGGRAPGPADKESMTLAEYQRVFERANAYNSSPAEKAEAKRLLDKEMANLLDVTG